MPFRARINPLNLARRHAAAVQYAPLLRAPVPAVTAPAISGPGPSTSAFALASMRGFRTTPRRPGFADFFMRKKTLQKDKRTAVLESLGPGRLMALIRAYDDLVKSGERLSADDLTAVLEALSAPTTRKPHMLRQRIWADLEGVHGVQPTADMYRFMSVGCVKFGDVEEALPYAREAYALGGELSASEWAALAACAAATPVPAKRKRLIDQTLAFARSHGQNTDRTYAAILGELVANNETAEREFSGILARMDAEDVMPGHWVEIQLVALHLKHGDLASAKAITSGWPSPDDVQDPKLARELGRSTIAVEMARGNPEGVETAVRSLPYGSNASPAVFVYLVQHRLSGLGGRLDPDRLLRVVDDISRSTGRDPSQTAWARLVSTVLERSDIDTAMAVYDAVRGRAAFMTPDLAREFIVKLCSSKPPNLTQAMVVYDDLVTTPTWEANRLKDQDTAKEIFSTLLRACDRAQPPAPGIAIELADAAKARGVTLPAQDITHFVVDNMTKSRDHPEAYDVYTHLVPLAEEQFTHRQYTHMLSTFIILDFPGSNVAPPDYVMEMVKDMRRAGHQPCAATLTSLLKSYASLSKKVTRAKRQLSNAESEFALDALLNATNDVYRLVSLDPMLEVDVPLLVALMDALSSVNAFQDAMEVWDDIVRRRASAMEALPIEEVRRDYGAALSVVLDTCGYSENGDRAKRIWAWGRRHGFLANRRIWSAYIECLARVGRYSEALDVLTSEMPAAGLKPTAAEVMIPVKFSWRQPKSIPTVLDRIRTAFPEYYDEAEKIVQVKEGL